MVYWNELHVIKLVGWPKHVVSLSAGLQALLGANWPNQLQKHKLTRTQTLAGLTKATANLRTAPDQENIPVRCRPWTLQTANPFVMWLHQDQSEWLIDIEVECKAVKYIYQNS